MKVLLTDYAWPDVEVERQVLTQAGMKLVVAPNGQEETLTRLAPEVEAIMTCWAPVTKRVIEAASRCRIIARMGIGLDNIDLQAAWNRGIVVTNVPDYCVHEVAEHTLALILALVRGVAHFHAQTKQGLYSRQGVLPLRRLRSLRLGVVGLGQIGTQVARLAQAFGMEVWSTSRRRRPSGPVPWCPLDELLQKCHIVSLHLPLNDQTRHLINLRRLRQMPRGSYLVNTARGGLVDHRALAQVLQEGHLAGAALDVQDPEPPPLQEPPFCLPQVIVTPHAAFASDVSVQELRRRAAEEVVRVLQGQQPRHPVRPA